MNTDYLKSLQLLSRAIYDLGSSHSNSLGELLTQDTLPRIEVYQRHLFGNIYNVLSQDFPILEKYISYNNFRFLIKEFILGHHIKSANIFASSKQFKSFLKRSFAIHRDDMVPYLAELDYFWSYAPSHIGQTLSLPEGVLTLWQSLLQREEGDASADQNNGALLEKPTLGEHQQVLTILSTDDHWTLSLLPT